MAKIRTLLNCPNCDEDITASGGAVNCPKCSYLLGPRSGGYQYPEYIMERFIRTPDPLSLRDVIVNMPIEKAKFLLEDAEQIMRLATGKKCSQDDIRILAETAVAVGKLGKAIIDLLDAGGKHVPGLYLTNINNSKETKSVELPQETVSGERPAIGTTNVVPAFFSEADGGRSPS